MIRSYELVKATGCLPRLFVQIQRFPHDVTAYIRYTVGDGFCQFHFPASWSPVGISEEIRRVLTLMESPNWYAELVPLLKRNEIDSNDDLPF